MAGWGERGTSSFPWVAEGGKVDRAGYPNNAKDGRMRQHICQIPALLSSGRFGSLKVQTVVTWRNGGHWLQAVLSRHNFTKRINSFAMVSS